MQKSKKNLVNYKKIIYVFLLFPTHLIIPENYPQISSLNNSDFVFRQHQEDIKRFYELAKDKNNAKDFQLSLYEYTTYKALDFLALSARFNLRPEALATINSITLPKIIKSGTRLLIPNIQAVFVPETPENTFEKLMQTWRRPNLEYTRRINVKTDSTLRSFFVYVNETFHPIERAYFYGHLFLLPISDAILTSTYGMRTNPFTGHQQFHGGIDLAAPKGTEVRAAQSGTIIHTEYDSIYGNYIIIRHAAELFTLYGHLEETLLTSETKIKAGEVIGNVGVSGLTTGPHLHFEVRQSGETINPSRFVDYD